jgi:parallel beta helix pectate lyase-like protein
MISALTSLGLLLALSLAVPITVRADDDRHDVTVRCDKGRTIGDALAHHRGAITIRIVGVCDEHVTVNRDDVSLVAGGPGAGIHGPRTDTDTVAVTGNRFFLDGLHVTGGRNAVVVTSGGRAMIRNCAVTSSGTGIIGGIGILFAQGASGLVDSCDSTGNNSDGITLDASIATITNSRITSNRRAGVLVFHGSTARIGLTDLLTVAGNVISTNGSNGIHVTVGSQALITGNTVSGNGTSPTGAFGRFGVTAFHSRINLIGGNTITDNFGAGVAINASTGLIGDAGFGLPTNNVIRGNSIAVASQGVNVLFNSTLVLRNATVDANNGTGVALSGRSVMTMVNGSVTGHAANGIQLSQGSAAIFQPALPLPVLSGNTPFDLKCLDGESSFTGPIAAGATIDCTGF